MHEGRRAPPPPDTLPKAIWAFLMENAQWVVVTLTVVMLIVVIVPPMIGSQRAAHDTIAQACARTLQATLATGEGSRTLAALLKQEDVHAACASPTLRVIPLAQPLTYAVQNTSGTHTYIVTLTSLNRTP